MRSSSAIKNFIWDILFYAVTIILGFFAPRMILLYYGSEVNGLSATITQILNIMLLLQAGASTAAVFSLYKPVADNDYQEIGEKLSAAENFFRKIAFLFLLIMLAGAAVTAVIATSGIRPLLIFYSFVLLGLRSFLDLLFTSKFRIIFTVDQRKYIISIASLIEQTIYYTLLFLTIYLHLTFIWLFVWYFAGCIVKIVFLRSCYAKYYKEKIPKSKKSMLSKIPGRNYSLANEVSHSAVGASPSVIMMILYNGFIQASIFTVYNLVSSSLALIGNALYSSFAPGFGNLIACGDQKNINRVFCFFQYFFTMFNTLLYMCTMYLLVPFVTLYTSNVNDADYVNVTLAVLIVVSSMVSAYRIPYNIAVSSFGFFKETWVQPVVTAVISIAISFALGKIDFTLIITGLIFFYIVNFVYQHFKIKKLVPYLQAEKMYKHIAISAVGIAAAYLASVYFPIKTLSVFNWLLAALFALILSALYIVITTFLFEREFLSDLRTYIMRIVFRKEV